MDTDNLHADLEESSSTPLEDAHELADNYLDLTQPTIPEAIRTISQLDSKWGVPEGVVEQAYDAARYHHETLTAETVFTEMFRSSIVATAAAEFDEKSENKTKQSTMDLDEPPGEQKYKSVAERPSGWVCTIRCTAQDQFNTGRVGLHEATSQAIEKHFGVIHRLSLVERAEIVEYLSSKEFDEPIPEEQISSHSSLEELVDGLLVRSLEACIMGHIDTSSTSAQSV